MQTGRRRSRKRRARDKTGIILPNISQDTGTNLPPNSTKGARLRRPKKNQQPTQFAAFVGALAAFSMALEPIGKALDSFVKLLESIAKARGWI